MTSPLKADGAAMVYPADARRARLPVTFFVLEDDMEPISQFRTHTGEIVKGQRLQDALNKVGDDWETLAMDIRAEDAYASHVTELQKGLFLAKMVYDADQIRAGYVESVTIAQRINTELTGECIALLS